MLAAIRAFAKSWVASLLIGLLVVSFSVWGIRDVFHPKFSDAIVTAGSHETSPSEFKRLFDGMRQQVSQRSGQDISIQDAVAGGLDQRALQEIEANDAFAEYLRRLGLVPAPQLVVDTLRREPGFFNALGQFDKQTYETKLRSVGLTPPQFEGLMTDEIAQNHLTAGVAAGLKAPQIYGALISSYELEGRSFSYFALDPHSVPAPPAPTDAQLQALISQHATELTRPEMRTLSVVRFSAKLLAPSMPVDEAAVQKLYLFRKDSLSQPEKRSLVVFTTPDAAKAQAIVAKLNAGQSPEAVGKALGVQPLTYDDKPQAAIADPAVAGAAFSAQNGQVAGPITSGLAGYAVIKITKVTPASVPTLESIRSQLEAVVKTDAAIQQVFGGVKKYEDAHDSGANLIESARAAGATPTPLGPITAQGADLSGHPAAGVTPKLLKEAFALPQGGESEMEDEGNGEYFAIRVQQVTPPTLPSLAELKPRLTQAFMQQAYTQALTARADALVQAIKKGQSFEAAAAEAHAKPGHVAGFTRAALSQGHQLSADMAEKLFTAKMGDIFDGPVGQMQILVARIDQVQPATGADAARAATTQSTALARQIYQDMLDAARTLSVSVVKPQGDLAAARTALGLTADDLPNSGAKPKRGPAL